MDPVVLTDETVLLSAPTAPDLDDITLACQDPQIAAWVTVPSPYTRADAEDFLQHVVRPGWEQGTDLTWVVRLAPTTGRASRLLGMVGLHGVADGSAEIGFWTAPWARGRGVVRRAQDLVLDHAFDPHGLDLVRVTWSAFVGNWPSRRVAWSAGFRVEGTVRLHGVQRGVRRDSWLATLLRDDPREPAEPWPAPTAERMAT
ncbi:GNAT family N-acetyltransferase [Actinotalea sp. K2]|uniref:GNAT family N-acetyltransferase n=1 Tax=Actinotalea sp. K2 TaxID=2939438 RepID=UPI00201752DF|nr:GNAT family protein [Actinotalea sp. K2]MCL3861919.1 GNAT family N-acetyltransferase [Actinotalea sp. K2]